MPTDEVLEVVNVYMAAWLELDEAERRRTAAKGRRILWAAAQEGR